MMTNAMLPDSFEDRIKSGLKFLAPLFLAGFGLYLVSFAILSVNGSLNKAVPTGSAGEMALYASGALLLSALIVAGMSSIYLGMRLMRYLHSEHQAKVMAKEIIQRLCTKEGKPSTNARQLAKIVH